MKSVAKSCETIPSPAQSINVPRLPWLLTRKLTVLAGTRMAVRNRRVEFEAKLSEIGVANQTFDTDWHSLVA